MNDSANPLLRRLACILLSVAMALSPVPTQAIAEAAEELGTVAYEGEGADAAEEPLAAEVPAEEPNQEDLAISGDGLTNAVHDCAESIRRAAKTREDLEGEDEPVRLIVTLYDSLFANLLAHDLEDGEADQRLGLAIELRDAEDAAEIYRLLSGVGASDSGEFDALRSLLSRRLDEDGVIDVFVRIATELGVACEATEGFDGTAWVTVHLGDNQFRADIISALREERDIAEGDEQRKEGWRRDVARAWLQVSDEAMLLLESKDSDVDDLEEEISNSEEGAPDDAKSIGEEPEARENQESMVVDEAYPVAQEVDGTDESMSLEVDAEAQTDSVALESEPEGDVPESVLTPQATTRASGICGTCPWTLDSDGLLTIGAGTLAGNTSWLIVQDVTVSGQSGESYWPWLAYSRSIRTVVAKSGVDCGEGLVGMFLRCSNLTSVDLSGFDTSSVTDMSFMFRECSSLTSINGLSNWNISRVKFARSVFSNCDSLTSADAISGWDMHNVRDTCFMFRYCSKIESMDLSSWDTSSVENNDDMLQGCNGIKRFKVGTKYVISEHAFPPSRGYVWRSSLTGNSYGVSQIINTRSGIADTYVLDTTKRDFSSCTVSLSQYYYAYDGYQKSPTVSVKDGADTLTNGVDYTLVVPSGRTNPGSYTYTVVGKGDYVGSQDLTLTITGRSISGCTVTLTQSSYTYDGTQKSPTVTVTDGSETLTSGTDYTLTVPSGRTNVGTYTYTVTGKGGYTGSATAKLTITAKGFSSCTVTVSPSSYVYDGTAKMPTVTVKDGSTTLRSGTDYAVSLPSNPCINVGTYSIALTGQGNYAGTTTASFKITPKTISSCTVTVTPSSYAYDGKQKNPTITVKDGSTTLKEGTHYTLTTPNGRANVGTYTYTVTGKGNYAGTTTARFKITPKAVSACTVTVSPSSYVYDGKQKNPAVTVKDGSTIPNEGTDYDLITPSCRTNAGTYTYTVTGKGNYTGTTSASFTITKAAPALKFASASVSKKDTDAPFTNALTKTTDGAVTFSSSDASVATVDPSTGKVTIKGAGKATITAKAAAGRNYKAGSASYALTVTASKTYEVAYYANGGTGTPSAQTKVEGVALKLSGVKPTKSFLVRYNASGGSVSPASKSVNCTFTGWNTRKDGKGASYAAGGSYDADAGATLYAQWANPKAGALATPTRSGYDFAGWYTSATGGSRVTSSTAITANMTVYARWSALDDPYDMGDETYSFDNYPDSDSPYGHCFGMSMTSAGYHLGLLDIRRIGGSASTPLYGFRLTQTVKNPICYYQGIQGRWSKGAIVAGGSRYLYGYSDIAGDWKAVVNYVKGHRYDGSGQLQIGFKGYGRNGKEGGHAINFLRYESVNGQDRIYAYDNNYPDQETYFYRDSSGKVLQAPVQTFSGGIISIALRDVKTYFGSVGDYDVTRAVYVPKGDASLPGYSYSLMEGFESETEYVMYVIPESVDKVTIVPNKNNADFIYMGTEYSFGEVTDSTRGELEFATMREGALVEEETFTIYEDEGGRFPDVKKGSWYYFVVNRAAGLGLITGYADGRFAPDDNITRGQVAVILWRMAGQPTAGPGAKSFSDVKGGAYYYDAVRWASSAGVVSGYANGTFGPDNKVTREQLAVMLANYAGKVAGLRVSGSRTDFASMSDASKVSSWAQPAVGWCFRNKILSGSQGRVLPNGDATRAAAAKMLVALYDMVS